MTCIHVRCIQYIIIPVAQKDQDKEMSGLSVTRTPQYNTYVY